MMIRLASLDATGLRHGFFTRQGGVSKGLYASLNCGVGSGDDAVDVAENRRRVAAALDLAADRLATCHQVHSPTVVAVDEPWPLGDRPRADAMVTRKAGIALGILTADCVPVLFADPSARVIGAAHAGWRGALGGVLDGTVAAMRDLGATLAGIRAGIGPSIGQASYEVGPEFPAPFLAASTDNARFFIDATRPGHFMFDIAGYVRARLSRLGIETVEATGGDTAAEPDRFFSYRRSCLRREPDYGREISAIALTG
jgi:YfiH family protein